VAKKRRSGTRRDAQHRHQQRSARSKRPNKPATDGRAISDDKWAEIVGRHMQRRKRQKRWGAVLALVGLMVIVNHALEHAESFDLLGPLLSSGAEDLVAGFPMGFILLLAAAILFGQLDEPPKRSTLARRRRS